MISDSIFKKYDIRGQIDKEFEISDTYELGLAIAVYLKSKDEAVNRIAIGMDGRLSSPLIKKEICNSFLDSGFDVTFIGQCTTPCVYFACHKLDVDCAIMITASHNPKDDNGLKILLKKESVWADQIQEIKNFYKQKINIKKLKKGIYKEINIIESYTNWLANEFEDLSDTEVNAIIDCGNGAAGTVLPTLINKLKLKNIELLFSEVDGNFPNHEPDPTVEKNLTELKNLLSNSKYNYGIGFDGDCDRFAIMNKVGKLIAGDQLLSIFAQFIKTDSTNNTVVFDIKCSNGLIEILNDCGLKSCISPTGFAHIKDLMKKTNAILGGELSGHYCFKDRYFGFDDGIYAMLRLIEILKNNSLESLLEQFPKKVSSKEIRIPCSNNDKEKIIKDSKIKLATLNNSQLIEIDGIRIDMPYGWGILRASNTEPMLSLRFEGNNIEDLNKIKYDFFDAMSPHFDKEFLREKFEL